VQFATVFAVMMPFLLALGAVAAVLRGRERNRGDSEAGAWRDTSLDDWRRERDAAAAREREQRRVATSETLSSGRAEETEEPVRQQRIGG
jgi:hypothetical protein